MYKNKSNQKTSAISDLSIEPSNPDWICRKCAAPMYSFIYM